MSYVDFSPPCADPTCNASYCIEWREAQERRRLAAPQTPESSKMATKESSSNAVPTPDKALPRGDVNQAFKALYPAGVPREQLDDALTVRDILDVLGDLSEYPSPNTWAIVSKLALKAKYRHDEMMGDIPF